MAHGGSWKGGQDVRGYRVFNFVFGVAVDSGKPLMAAKVKFSCVKCGERIDPKPEVVLERDEYGLERLFPTWDNMCSVCKTMAFWRSWDRKVKGDG